MYGKVKFMSDWMKTRNYYHELTKANEAWIVQPDPEVAWEIYKRATQPSLGFAVMGRTVIDKVSGPAGAKSPAQPGDFGNAITFAEHLNFGVNSTNEELGTYTGFAVPGGHVGSILNFYTGATRGPGLNSWHFLYNDCWILGGVHGGVPFQIASPRTKANVYNAQYGLTVTGRELAGLKTFGYHVFPVLVPGQNQGMQQVGEIARCADPNLAEGASLASYRAAVETYSASEAMVCSDLVNQAAG